MKCKSRKKAWIGAAISAATSLASAGLNAYLQNKENKEKMRQANLDNIYATQANLTENINDTDYINNYYDRIRLIPQFSYGGRKRKKCNFGNDYDIDKIYNNSLYLDRFPTAKFGKRVRGHC